MKSTEVIYDVNKSMLSSNNNLFLFNSIHQDINKIKLEFIQDDERNDELPKEDSCPFICEDVDVVVDAKDFDSPYIDFAIKGLTTEMTKTTSNSNEEIKKKKIKKIFQTYKEKKTLPCKGRSKKADSFLFPSNLRITRSNIKTIMQSNQAMKSFIRFQTKNDDFLKSTLTSREFLNKNKLHF